MLGESIQVLKEDKMLKHHQLYSSASNVTRKFMSNNNKETAIDTRLSVVEDGLILYLDAGNTSSYPGSGSTWFDLSGSGNDMTLTGSPTFSSSNGGVLQFNGSNQYGSLTSLNYSSTNYTIMAASRYSGATRGRVISSMNNNWLFGHWSGGSVEYYAEGWIYQGSPNDIGWRIYTAMENHGADQRSFYVNNSILASNSTAGSAGFNGLSVGRWGFYNSEYSTCEVSFILVYNRLLLDDEITQNFNLLRERFAFYTDYALNKSDGTGSANGGSINDGSSQPNTGGTATFTTGIPFTTLRVIYGNMANGSLGNPAGGAQLYINGSPVSANGVYGSDGYNSSYVKYYDASNGTLNSIGISAGVTGSHETGIYSIIINGTKLNATGPTW